VPNDDLTIMSTDLDSKESYAEMRKKMSSIALADATEQSCNP
jgi:hypothetical protein